MEMNVFRIVLPSAKMAAPCFFSVLGLRLDSLDFEVSSLAPQGNNEVDLAIIGQNPGLVTDGPRNILIFDKRLGHGEFIDALSELSAAGIFIRAAHASGRLELTPKSLTARNTAGVANNNILIESVHLSNKTFNLVGHSSTIVTPSYFGQWIVNMQGSLKVRFGSKADGPTGD